MATQGIEALFNEYKDIRPESQMTLEQFDTFLLFFPCLLVVASDGVIDDEEWVYVKYLAKFMSDNFKDDITPDELMVLESNFFSDLEFLAKNLDEWESKFLNTIKSYLAQVPEVKDDISEILLLFADASDGQSDEEIEKIEFIKKELQIED